MSEIEKRNQELEQALEILLATDGHTTKCAFTGCTCGSIEDYKAARAEACRLLRPDAHLGAVER